jgi:hypothetical protein
MECLTDAESIPICRADTITWHRLEPPVPQFNPAGSAEHPRNLGPTVPKGSGAGLVGIVGETIGQTPGRQRRTTSRMAL